MLVIKTRKRNLGFVSFILGRMMFILGTTVDRAQSQEEMVFIEVSIAEAKVMAEHDVIFA